MNESSDASRHYTDAQLAHIAVRARNEANAGAPAGMVATYVEIEVRHLLDQHAGDAMECQPCHEALGLPVVVRSRVERLRNSRPYDGNTI